MARPALRRADRVAGRDVARAAVSCPTDSKVGNPADRLPERARTEVRDFRAGRMPSGQEDLPQDRDSSQGDRGNRASRDLDRDLEEAVASDAAADLVVDREW